MFEKQEADVEFDAGTFVAMVEKVVVNWKDNKSAIVLHNVMKNGITQEIGIAQRR